MRWDEIERSTAWRAVLVLAIVGTAALNVLVFRLPWIESFVGERPDYVAHAARMAAAIAAAQSITLFFAYRAFRLERRLLLVVGFAIAVAIEAVLSFTIPPQSTDVYAYIGYAKLSTIHDAYAPPAIPLSKPFDEANRQWGMPLVPSVYGPLWLAYDRALVRPARTIEEAIFRLRLGNVVLLIVIIICMRVLGASAVVLWLLAVNPLVWNNFVLSVHNDVVPIALTLAAAICIRKRWTAAAVALVVAAGLSKITFSLIGLTAFAAIPVMRTRLAASTCAAACVVAGSVIFGGAAYFAAFNYVSHMYHQPYHAAGFVIHHALAAFAVAAVAVAVVWRKWIRAAAWSFGAVGINYYSWYEVWGLAYVMLSGRDAAAFLISLPIVGALIFAPLPPLLGAPTMALVCFAGALCELMRRQD